MDYPVTCITPSGNRPEHLKRCIEQFLKQDYPNKYMIIALPDNVWDNHIDFDWYRTLCLNNTVPIRVIFNNGSLGVKRNSCVELCHDGDVVCSFDDDDIYAPDWITKSVEHLINTKADIVGLSNAYFYNGNMLEYKYNGGQPYVLGATMCYWKHVWEKQPFRDINTAEDLYFQSNNVVIPHFYKHSFLATLHGNNTASHKNMSIYKPVDINPAELYPFVEF